MRKFCWITILFALMTINCQRTPDQAVKAETQSEAVPVRAIIVEDRTIVETLKITGEIIPLYQVDVYPKINGIIRKESVGLGQQVRIGATLAEMEQDIPGMEFSPVKIKATNDGIITMDGVEIGSRVSTQKPLYSISGLKQIYFTAKVIESFSGKIKTGDFVNVELAAYPNEKIKGRVAEISPTVDSKSRSAEIKILLSNQKLRLKPGMFGRATMKVDQHTGIAIPLDAIVQSGTNQYVFQILGGKTRRISIETGIIMNDFIELHSTLQAGDSIVIFGQNLLKDGSEVRIIKE